MNTNKFDKNRSVWSHWYTTPTVYMLDATGSNTEKKTKKKRVLMTYEEAKKRNDELNEKFPNLKVNYTRELYDKFVKENYPYIYKEVEVEGEADKTLAIIQFYGNKALVGWRNNDTAKMGMTRLCPIIKKDKKTYLIYRGRKIEISHKKGGWVL